MEITNYFKMSTNQKKGKKNNLILIPIDFEVALKSLLYVNPPYKDELSSKTYEKKGKHDK